jgi:hypothetical protein
MFGFTNPVLIARDTIIAGHGRVDAAKLLKMDQVLRLWVAAVDPPSEWGIPGAWSFLCRFDDPRPAHRLL